MGDVLSFLRIRIGAIDAIRPVRERAPNGSALGVWQAHCFHGLMRTAGRSKILLRTAARRGKGISEAPQPT